MSDVTTHTLGEAEAGMRLDRWFRQHFPTLSHGRLEKLLRTGQIRIDGKRATAGQRLEAGQTLRIPPLGEAPASAAPRPRPAPKLDPRKVAELRARVLYKDEDVIALDKPAGLAVQGGTGMTQHLDAMMEALRFDAPEPPRLVHRLDKDTSGVLLLARNARAAAALAEGFRAKTARKVYWALVVGVPKLKRGRIDLALAKLPGRAGEKMAPVESGDEGKRAITLYATVDTAHRRAAWLALMPLTGRTHQLRAHCAYLGTPILGDGKYGGQAAFLPGAEALARQLHLHARRIEMPHPKGGVLKVTAPLPAHMRASWDFFGFDAEDDGDPFQALEL